MSATGGATKEAKWRRLERSCVVPLVDGIPLEREAVVDN